MYGRFCCMVHGFFEFIIIIISSAAYDKMSDGGGFFLFSFYFSMLHYYFFIICFIFVIARHCVVSSVPSLKNHINMNWLLHYFSESVWKCCDINSIFIIDFNFIKLYDFIFYVLLLHNIYMRHNVVGNNNLKTFEWFSFWTDCGDNYNNFCWWGKNMFDAASNENEII